LLSKLEMHQQIKGRIMYFMNDSFDFGLN